ncbi:hypothetical protein BC941DRAFT_349080 [Chlamydoabsidia padenii]|nr:hypothetical protein BC941DRAFT_349080 [Chlamydoabsidia padenii]
MSVPSLFSLSGKNAIVTGGSRGLGYEMCKALAGAGANVAFIYIESPQANDLAIEIGQEFNVKCQAYEANISSADQVHKVMGSIYKDFGDINILIANAGIHDAGPSETFDLDLWKHIFDVNVHGAFYCAQFVGNRMLKKGKGSIIFISSVAGHVGIGPQQVASYSASKGAVTSMTKALANEWATRGVRVNSINPGYMTTVPFGDSPMTRFWKLRTPMGRFGKPDELNGAAIYLASDASSYVTGTQLFIDGGYSSA